MATSFCGGGIRSTRREPPTLCKQLVNFITCGCESSSPLFCSLHSWARTHAVLVIHAGLYELFEPPGPQCLSHPGPKIVERCKIDIPSTQLHDRPLSRLATGTSIESGGVMLTENRIPVRDQISYCYVILDQHNYLQISFYLLLNLLFNCIF